MPVSHSYHSVSHPPTTLGSSHPNTNPPVHAPDARRHKDELIPLHSVASSPITPRKQNLLSTAALPIGFALPLSIRTLINPINCTRRSHHTTIGLSHPLHWAAMHPRHPQLHPFVLRPRSRSWQITCLLPPPPVCSQLPTAQSATRH
ncbi:hypothetical protein CMUS01_04429 [Colletotrichum musicola]|uniref:Uncharacterized protein n=1 Tax=Colletotrichum musicola TaxID=2175873 RepID=A0A8H6NN62_9PEZI|nr:hypothetical protein CMUS01_04429 [Colletotrichum musicola]